MKKVAVIIPIYKAHDTIQSTLHSVFMQRHIDYKCYLIVDGEENGSYDYLKKQFDLEIHYMPENKGPGVARQFGIDISTEPFISFIDADDAYLTTLGLFYQHLPFDEDRKNVLVSCFFWQEQKNMKFKLHECDMVWMHGKMYKRSFIDKYDIRFNETRANEDVGFNTQCQCYSSDEEKIAYIEESTYIWQWRDDSTVRADNEHFAYDEAITGFVENRMYAVKRVFEKTITPNEEIKNKIQIMTIGGLVYLFKAHTEAKTRIPEQLKHIKSYAKIYYHELYSLVDDEELEQKILDFLKLDDRKGYNNFKKLLNKPLNKREIAALEKINKSN